MRAKRSWLVPVAVAAIATAAAADAILGRSSPGGADAPRGRAETTGSETTPSTTSTTSSVEIGLETSPPRRCRERQLDLGTSTGEPTAVLAHVRGRDCKQPPVKIRVRITSAAGAAGRGTIFGPEPPAFQGFFAAGSIQVAAFRYSPACRGEQSPFHASVTAGPYSDDLDLSTVEPCGQRMGSTLGRPCTETSAAGPWASSCQGEWVRDFVRAAGFR